MNDDSTCVLAVIFIGMACLILGLLGGSSIEEKHIQKQFAQTKCAQYSPITGEFEILKEIE